MFQRGFGKNLPVGLPLDVKILPEYLRDLGYSTHGFGKWHLGFCSEAYTPLRRGFDTYDGPFIGDDEEDLDEESNITSAKRKLKKGRANKFDSNVYASKTETLLKNKVKTKQPFFIYLSLITKVYPKSKDHSQSIINARITKISEMDAAVNKVLKLSRDFNHTQHFSTVLDYSETLVKT